MRRLGCWLLAAGLAVGGCSARPQEQERAAAFAVKAEALCLEMGGKPKAGAAENLFGPITYGEVSCAFVQSQQPAEAP